LAVLPAQGKGVGASLFTLHRSHGRWRGWRGATSALGRFAKSEVYNTPVGRQFTAKARHGLHQRGHQSVSFFWCEGVACRSEGEQVSLHKGRPGCALGSAGQRAWAVPRADALDEVMQLNNGLGRAGR